MDNFLVKPEDISGHGEYPNAVKDITLFTFMYAWQKPLYKPRQFFTMQQIQTNDIWNNIDFLVRQHNESVEVSKKYRTSVYFPLNVLLDENILRALYLFWGDGSYIEKIQFTNKEPELIRYIIKMFEKYFGISKSLWRLRILYNERDGEAVENIKYEWLKALNFNQEQLYPTIAISGYTSNSHGNGRIVIDKLTYCDFIRNMLRYVNTLVVNEQLTDKQLVSSLDGILNAEGSALVDSIGLHRIVITLHEKEIMFVRKILSQLNINNIFVESRQKKLIVSGWRQLYSFLKLFVRNDTCPFSIHSTRRQNTILGFISHKRTAALYRYLSIIEKHKDLNLAKLAALADRNETVVKRTVLVKLKEFTSVAGEGKRGNPYKINLSFEGKEFLVLMKKLYEWEVKYDR